MIWRVQGVKQNSNVSTLGGLAILGRGEVLGFYATWDLPVSPEFTQSFSLGFDHKDFDQQIETTGGTITAPIRYIPFTASYLAGWGAMALGLTEAATRLAEVLSTCAGISPRRVSSVMGAR
jgi:hypothetical protein